MTCRHYQDKGATPTRWFIECDCVRRYFRTPEARDGHIKRFCNGPCHKCPIRRGQTQQPGRGAGR